MLKRPASGLPNPSASMKMVLERSQRLKYIAAVAGFALSENVGQSL
jgi:hypothetical protein